MLHLTLSLFLIQAAAVSAPPASPAVVAPVTVPAASADSGELVKVNRIYVESLGDDPLSKQMQTIIMSALLETKRFKVTENRDRADAILKGMVVEKTSQELHAFSESTAVGGAKGGSHGEVSGSVINGNGSISGSSSGGFSASHAAISDSSVNTETISRARLALRLVNADGDVIWSTTQESNGGKYKGAASDAADMCIRQLIRDIDRSERISGQKKTDSAESGSEHH